MTSGKDLILAIPNEAVQWQKAGRDVQHGPRWLFRGAGVHDRDTAVMSSESESVSARRKGDTLDPASGVVQVFTTDGVEWQALTPSTGLGALIDTLDEAGKDSSMRVGGASSEQNRVRVPGQCSDSTANRLLQVLRNPPVVLLLEVTNSDDAGSGTDGKLLLGGRPSDKCCSSVDSKKDQSRLPARGGLLPNIGIAI